MKRSKLALFAVVVSFCLSNAVFSPPLAFAEDKYWIGGSGFWDEASNWTPAGQPQDGDAVFLINSGPTDMTVEYRNPGLYSPSLGTLRIDASGTGTVTLSQAQGVLFGGPNLTIGYSGSGSFDQSGGNMMFVDVLIGELSSGVGTYSMTGGSAGAAIAWRIGYGGTGTFIQSGGNAGGDSLTVGSQPGSNGTFILSGDAKFHTGYYQSIGSSGNGTMIQSGGENTAEVDLGVGDLGTYILEGGSLRVGGHPAGGHEVVGGNFLQTGGSNVMVPGNHPYFENGLYLAGSPYDSSGGSGSYELRGGELSAPNEFIGYTGIGSFTQAGGSNTVQKSLIIAANPGSSGTYSLSGGTLTAPDIRNNGTLNYSGGELHLATDGSGTLTNSGDVNLSGKGTRTIDGNIVNNGTFKTTHTTASYTGTFTNNGAYISDPATQFFNDLTVGQSGYLVGQNLDKFFISGNFISNSIMNMDWNTRQAYLGFINGDDNLHDFFLTGRDFGATMSGYANNFSWGTLDVAEDILTLYDGNADAGAALYLRELWGAKITKDGIIANLIGFDGLDIYYMADLACNAYLRGLTYSMEGGGYLIPIGAPVPEPATVLLLASGLVGLAGVRRLRKN